MFYNQKFQIDINFLKFKDMKRVVLVMFIVLSGIAGSAAAKGKWTSLFNGKDLDGWFIRGNAAWTVRDGILTGEGGMGHIYTDVTASDFEFRGKFRITDQGQKSNSGWYFRANPPADNPHGYPRGYEAQICHNQDAYTGWLWKPGKPTGEAKALLTRDGEWFEYHIKAVGSKIEFRINGKKVMTYRDDEYTYGHFAIQGHNPGMMIEARDLYYRDLSKSR